MKNYPLSIQIWIVFVSITMAISILLSFIMPLTLRDFFTKEIYKTIDSAQEIIFNQFEINDIDEDQFKDVRTVRHLLIYEGNHVVLSSPISIDFLRQVKEDIETQRNVSKHYTGKINQERVFYTITKGKAFGRDAYLVSYMGDSYREDLVNTLFKKLLNTMIIVILLSWIPAILLSRYLSSPLVSLQQRVDRLANKEWSDPIAVDRKDEIGKLGNSIEELRTELIRQDEAEQSFLQYISHELKTPVMVIRSYTQAINDGIFPGGDLKNSIEIIDNEAERLEKRIRNLLYLTKLDYLENHNQENLKTFPLDKLIKDVVDRLNWSRKDLDWIIELDEVNINGDLEQWKIVLENLIDNQIRYAKSSIQISLKKSRKKTYLKIYNDGDHIDQALLDNMFKEYNKGYKGEFGLGLAIVKRILDIYNSTIYAKNEEIGVSFNIEIDENPKKEA